MGKMKALSKKYTCPCCRYKTLDSPVGNFDICSICFWEADGAQSEDENYNGGPNDVSLKEARQNFVKCGYSSKKVAKFVRKPTNKDVSGEK